MGRYGEIWGDMGRGLPCSCAPAVGRALTLPLPLTLPLTLALALALALALPVRQPWCGPHQQSDAALRLRAERGHVEEELLLRPLYCAFERPRAHPRAPWLGLGLGLGLGLRLEGLG